MHADIIGSRWSRQPCASTSVTRIGRAVFRPADPRQKATDKPTKPILGHPRFRSAKLLPYECEADSQPWKAGQSATLGARQIRGRPTDCVLNSRAVGGSAGCTANEDRSEVLVALKHRDAIVGIEVCGATAKNAGKCRVPNGYASDQLTSRRSRDARSLSEYGLERRVLLAGDTRSAGDGRAAA